MPIMPDIQFIAVAPFECKCPVSDPGHICVSSDTNHIPLKLADITPNLQWMISVEDELSRPEYVIDDVKFTSFAFAKKFVDDFQVVRPFTIMPKNFTGFTIRGNLFFKTIQDVIRLQSVLPNSRHVFWETLADDLQSLKNLHRSMARAYPRESTEPLTFEQTENGTHCVSCNEDLHLRSYDAFLDGDESWKGTSVAILAKNYIVLCPTCAAAGIKIE